jgi:hypothetical protein
MATKQYVGVYLPEHRGEPVALFRDAHYAQMFRRQLDNANDVIVEPARDWEPRLDLEEQWHGTPTPPAPGSTDDPDGILRAQIRARLEREERERALEEEIRRELDAERKGDGDKGKKPAATELRG